MTVEIKVPDIGDFKDVPVIEVHVQPGAKVAVDDPLVTLESDKATMEIPAPFAGVVQELRVAVGDRVSEGHVLATLTSGSADGDAAEPDAPDADVGFRQERVPIDAAHREVSTRREDARGFPEQLIRIGLVMQHICKDHDVVGSVVEWKIGAGILEHSNRLTTTRVFLKALDRDLARSARFAQTRTKCA